MIEVVYYRRPDGTEPVRDWINAQDSRVKRNMYRKITSLNVNGVAFLGTNSMDIIAGHDKGLYELRNRGLGWRLAVYHDVAYSKFVILWGWTKTKTYEREIEKSRSLLQEYLGQR